MLLTPNKVIGDRIRRVRIRSKLTQQQLGELIHVSHDRIQRLEQGWAADAWEVREIARVLKIDVRQLLR